MLKYRSIDRCCKLYPQTANYQYLLSLQMTAE